MNLHFIPITESATDLDSVNQDPEILDVIQTFRTLYKSNGYHPPWIGYFVLWDGVVAGTCAFKGKPVENKVEIAYYTYKSFENKGLATAMCRKLVNIALKTDKSIIITAQTLKEKNASTRLLERNKFVLTGTAIDHEAGEVWEWTYLPGS